MEEANFRVDTQDAESLLLETDTHGYLYNLEYSKEDLKQREGGAGCNCCSQETSQACLQGRGSHAGVK